MNESTIAPVRLDDVSGVVPSPTRPSTTIGRLRAFGRDVWAVGWRGLVLLVATAAPIEFDSAEPGTLLGAIALSVLALGWIGWRGEAFIRATLRDRAPTLPWRITGRHALAFALLGILEGAATCGIVDAMALDPVGGVEIEDPDLRQPVAILAFILGPVLLAPLAEELLFRGMLQGMFTAWARPLLAYVATAACFAAMHGTSDIFWLYLSSSVVWSHVARHHGVVATAAIHAGYNGLLIAAGLVMMLATDSLTFPEAWLARAFRTPLGAGLSASVWVLSLALLWRMPVQRPATPADSPRPQ